jgi:hypothetical protein
MLLNFVDYKFFYIFNNFVYGTELLVTHSFLMILSVIYLVPTKAHTQR